MLVRFECSRGRRHKEIKVADPFKHRTSNSKRILCPVRVKVRSPKVLNGCWRISSLVINHNHDLQADGAHFRVEPQKLPPEIVTKIQHYAKTDIGLRNILSLLRNDFPEHNFAS